VPPFSFSITHLNQPYAAWPYRGLGRSAGGFQYRRTEELGQRMASVVPSPEGSRVGIDYGETDDRNVKRASLRLASAAYDSAGRRRICDCACDTNASSNCPGRSSDTAASVPSLPAIVIDEWHQQTFVNDTQGPLNPNGRAKRPRSVRRRAGRASS
jgi:hypothetical protein